MRKMKNNPLIFYVNEMRKCARSVVMQAFAIYGKWCKLSHCDAIMNVNLISYCIAPKERLATIENNPPFFVYEPMLDVRLSLGGY